jgi:hypothetical protein
VHGRKPPPPEAAKPAPPNAAGGGGAYYECDISGGSPLNCSGAYFNGKAVIWRKP